MASVPVRSINPTIRSARTHTHEQPSHLLLLLLLVGAATMLSSSIRGAAAASMTRRSLSGFVRMPAQPARWASSSAAARIQQQQQQRRTVRPISPSPCGAAAAAAPAVAAAAPAAAAAAGAPLQLLDIYELSEADLGSFLQETLGQPKYRAAQVRSWLYQRGAASFEEMLDLPKPLRASLAEHFRLGRYAAVRNLISAPHLHGIKPKPTCSPTPTHT